MSSWKKIVRDPFLADAMRDFSKELGILRRTKHPDTVKQQVFFRRKLAEDAMIRLIPFLDHMRPVIQEVQNQCKTALQVLENKPKNEDIERYGSRIEQRVQQYAKFLEAA